MKLRKTFKKIARREILGKVLAIVTAVVLLASSVLPFILR